jgi:hypothetical protein
MRATHVQDACIPDDFDGFIIVFYIFILVLFLCPLANLNKLQQSGCGETCSVQVMAL